jgi:hypothetical protein
MPLTLEAEIAKLLIKLRASGHALDVDALAHSIHDEHRDIGLQVIKDRIRLHINRLRCSH